MKAALLLPILLGVNAASSLAIAQTPAPPAPPSPGEIVAAAPAADWADIAPDDLLVMTLSNDAKGKPRTVIIQLMPAPFSQAWVSNIRTIAKARWFDGIAVVRVQDNYVTQWGDPNGELSTAKALPAGLKTIPEKDYQTLAVTTAPIRDPKYGWVNATEDAYGFAQFWRGWPLGRQGLKPIGQDRNWPLHCYGAVGVGRGMSPDTGSGAELYTVIGHAPRHLDRNIAVVGRVIEGMEHLSSLPRGHGPLGFYETAQERTPILSMRIASDLTTSEQPRFQFLSTESGSFAKYADARANRRDPFFLVPAGGADICNIPVPIRRKP